MDVILSLEDKLKNLPEKPGIYIMRDEGNEIIYVGKAKNLKNRVKQYFQASKGHSPKVVAMVERIVNLEYIITDTELEALILECNLIKKHRPKYNILLKDDKHYPYIKVTVNEDYPRIMITREIKKDGAKYFGPYTDKMAVNRTIETINKLFPIRSCNKNIARIEGKERPCLNFHINRCMAPCQGNIDKQQYKDVVRGIILVLDGKQEEMVGALEQKMQQAAENLDFERAAEIRDSIASLRKIGERQKIISSSMVDQDIIAMARADGEACMQVFFVRGGKLIGREHFLLDGSDLSDHGEVLSGFIKQFYNGDIFVPKEIILQHEIEDADIIENWLSEKRGSKVKLTIPQKGEKQKLIEMVSKNAEDTIKLLVEKYKQDEQKSMGAISELSGYIGLPKVPKRIEAFDISHLQGVENVGSMIVFENGKPKNSDYRRFKIKYIEGANDYESMKEVVERRFIHGLKEREMLEREGKDIDSGKFAMLPDLILIDGGLGQVNAVLPILKEMNLDIPVCGMVKDDKHRTRGLIYNELEIPIPISSHAFRLITHVQDEAHRFAISYHRSLRSKTAVQSQLDEVPGVGPARRQALLKKFGSLKNIKAASIEELSTVQGMNKKTAEMIYNYFNL
ncbi:MAG: excinuclease ABC subunit C [Clostridiales bacterium GWB2_37_7]|nr:MAG: excinuclease ABC subunit C [Clostridiales bacterium GWB2_37_7]